PLLPRTVRNGPGENYPIVQPERSFRPELEVHGSNAVTDPVWGPWHVPPYETPLLLRKRLFEYFAPLQRRGLVAGPSADAAVARPGCEVAVRFLGADGLHRSSDPDLTPQRLPVQNGRGLHVRLQLRSLSGRGVGEEDEPGRVVVLQEDHADVRQTIVAHRRDRHRVRVIGLGGRRGLQPPGEVGERRLGIGGI